ncbi:MAG: tripartite tricarboxylate transporter substrate binding protein [Burkholderiales bacterium]|nr:tripartite tricarboxylate transporter substrate binding protein [Burkholderiales bacterium]
MLQMTLLLVSALCGFSVHAQQKWPTKPIRMVHGFISGGSVDITARLLAVHMSEMLGQQVIVDGRPGAGGTVGAGIVARGEPDGHTLFLMASGHATSVGLYRSLPYDAVRDFTMISMVAANPFVMASASTYPAQSVADVLRMAKEAPGKINYGTGGVGTGMHLASVLFQSRAGVRLNHIPYKGGNAAPMALLSGEIPIIFNTPAGVDAHVTSGRMRALAITTGKRFSMWPNVPAMAETIPGFDVRGWYALAAPKELPASLVKRLNDVVQATLRRTEVSGKLVQLGAEVTPSTAGDAQKFLASEVARWVRLIREENIPQQN